MKVLMVNHPDWAIYQGGDAITLSKTAAAPRSLGVEVVERCDAEPDATGFDVAHVFNLRTFEQTARQVASLHRSGVPIVLTPFHMMVDYGEWATVALQAILIRAGSEAERQELLAAYQSRQLTVTLADNRVRTADSAFRPSQAIQEFSRSILGRIDCVLPNSYLEMDRLRKDLSGAVDTPFAVIPLGVETATFLNADPAPFVRRHGIREYVLQVSRIETLKNQLGLAYALRDLDVPLVLVGKVFDQEYLDLCRRFGPRNLTILPHLPLNELCGAYAAARVHVQANWTETCGLVTLEACSLAGCNVVCSTAGYELEFFRDMAYYCDPVEIGTIRSAVEKALANYDRDAARRQALRDLILREYNWRRVAERTLEVYQRVIGARASPG